MYMDSDMPNFDKGKLWIESEYMFWISLSLFPWNIKILTSWLIQLVYSWDLKDIQISKCLIQYFIKVTETVFSFIPNSLFSNSVEKYPQQFQFLSALNKLSLATTVLSSVTLHTYRGQFDWQNLVFMNMHIFKWLLLNCLTEKFMWIFRWIFYHCFLNASQGFCILYTTWRSYTQIDQTKTLGQNLLSEKCI